MPPSVVDAISLTKVFPFGLHEKEFVCFWFALFAAADSIWAMRCTAGLWALVGVVVVLGTRLGCCWRMEPH
jgi:hypothetical protein